MKRLWSKRPSEQVTPRRAPANFANASLDSEELLGRPPRAFDQRAARRFVAGRRVMITGAGGTIGSELVRQVLSFEPASIALVDNSEFNLYEIDLELRESGSTVPRSTHLTDVCRIQHMRPLFRKTQPEIVLHAAAFKHVPIAEENPCAAALTNVLGAKTVFDLSVEFGSETVVFISTDKAVNPSSMMGATKRIAELYAQALDVSQVGSRFVTVRFGNVLGSTGSVAPLFQRQIAKGGPVTVTHPDISRYFMTTREAVQLVLQSASLDPNETSVVAHDGRVFVLDMGDPIKIVDLARRMIALSGEDVEIAFSGLRPGEKLFEELFLDSDRLVKSGADGVLLASPAMIDLPLLSPRLEDVIRTAVAGDDAALAEAVHHLVPEYRAPDGPAAEANDENAESSEAENRRRA
ncbi:MAG: polysaccharide biosynthesis protein [Pseudomonadota bacterium]